MSYSEPLINQIYRFFLGVGFGTLMAVLYELFSVFKSIVGTGRKTVIALDIIFSVIFTVLSFFFMLVYNEGEARFNLIAAQLLGLYAFHITFGKRLVLPMINLNEKIWQFLKRKNIKRNKN